MTSAQQLAIATNRPFRILSLDGGGAKGFYTLGALEEIEALTGKRICETFDLIYGTSTGAIIAALLGLGKSVTEVRAMYEEHVPKIMGERSARARTRALRKLAEEVFGGAVVGDFKTRVGIVATNWDEEKPLIFKSSSDMAHGSKGSFIPFWGCNIADAVVGSCSADPFFEQQKIKQSNGDVIQVADGGFCANNPTLYALSDALLPLGLSQSDVRLVSIGVGSYPEPTKWKKARRVLGDLKLLKFVPGSTYLQKVMGTNTSSMDQLRVILFGSVPTIRINDTFNEPHMATDLLEHDLNKLNRLVKKGRISFSKHETRLKEYLIP